MNRYIFTMTNPNVTMLILTHLKQHKHNRSPYHYKLFLSIMSSQLTNRQSCPQVCCVFLTIRGPDWPAQWIEQLTSNDTHIFISDEQRNTDRI